MHIAQREFGQAEERKGWPVEDRESYRWIKSHQVAAAAVQKRNPHIRLVSVGDFYELMEYALREPDGPAGHPLCHRHAVPTQGQGAPAQLDDTSQTPATQQAARASQPRSRSGMGGSRGRGKPLRAAAMVDAMIWRALTPRRAQVSLRLDSHA